MTIIRHRRVRSESLRYMVLRKDIDEKKVSTELRTDPIYENSLYMKAVNSIYNV